jgi:hypothetical protein
VGNRPSSENCRRTSATPYSPAAKEAIMS